MAKTAKSPSVLPMISMEEYLKRQIPIAQSMGRTQIDIANDMGYENPNMVSMMKRGKVKVPLDKVPSLARALGVDPTFLFRLALIQFVGDDDENLELLSEMFGVVTTRNEQAILKKIRSVTKNTDPELTRDLERKIEAAFKP